jgi:NADPH:quinone reductase-like Zn-dependent oxidoreductase
MFTLKLARSAGMKVIMTSSSDKKLSQISAQSTDLPLLILNYSTHPEWHEEVLKLTDGIGVDLVVEVGGSNLLVKSMKCTRHGGTISQVGYLSKKDPAHMDEFLDVLIDPRIVLR